MAQKYWHGMCSFGRAKTANNKTTKTYMATSAEINGQTVQFVWVGPDRVTDENRDWKYLVVDTEGKSYQDLVALVGGEENATQVLHRYVRNKAIGASNAATEEVVDDNTKKVISRDIDEEKAVKLTKSALEVTLGVSLGKLNSQYASAKSEFDKLILSVNERMMNLSLRADQAKSDPEYIRAKELSEEIKSLEAKIASIKANK